MKNYANNEIVLKYHLFILIQNVILLYNNAKSQRKNTKKINKTQRKRIIRGRGVWDQEGDINYYLKEFEITIDLNLIENHSYSH